MTQEMKCHAINNWKKGRSRNDAATIYKIATAMFFWFAWKLTFFLICLEVNLCFLLICKDNLLLTVTKCYNFVLSLPFGECFPIFALGTSLDWNFYKSSLSRSLGIYLPVALSFWRNCLGLGNPIDKAFKLMINSHSHQISGQFNSSHLRTMLVWWQQYERATV